MAKYSNSIYHQGRHRSWVKVKCSNKNEYIVVGMTKPSGARKYFGSLLLAEDLDGTLVYRGRVGTGFKQNDLKRLENTFSQYIVEDPPVIDGLVDSNIKAWIRPHFFAEISFEEQTSSGLLRQPVFLGLRKDKEFEASEEIVKLTHPQKIYYKEEKITKERLWEYYREIFDEFKKWVSRQPLSLLRCPEGYDKDCFYQKHLKSKGKHPPNVDIKEKEKTGAYAYINSELDVKSLVQLGVLEFHIWNSKIDSIEEPIYVVFDLDPGRGIKFNQVIRGARIVRKALKAFGKNSYVRTTGGAGLHVLTTVHGMSWEEAFNFSKYMAGDLAEKHPKLFVDNSSKAKRKGKIYVDYLRNKRSATSIANYSTRAREGATVATPLAWSELKKDFDPRKYNIFTIPKRLKRLKAHPWAPFLEELEDT